MVMSNRRPGPPPRMTRRKFLRLLGVAGGSAIVFSALDAWNLATASGLVAPPTLEGNPNGTRVVVLGGGPAGLTAAYELMRRGYDVRLLEARQRPGGHVFTVRGGSTSDEIGAPQQTARFEAGQYFDAGAWRIPYLHRATLYYPKHFGIAMEVHKNQNWNAWAYMEGVAGHPVGQKFRIREVNADMAGYTAELLAKALDQRMLETELSEDDIAVLVEYLIQQGLLDRDDLTYRANSARGERQAPGAGNQPGAPSEPIPLADLLPFAAQSLHYTSGLFRAAPAIDQQETMLQPVGGMSTIYERGFVPALGERVRFGAEVVEIRQSPGDVTVVYRTTATGRTERLTADFCVCTIPLSVLKEIPADFSGPFREAISAGSFYLPVGKGGLQFRRRFWEEDDWIYGGITFTNLPRIGTIAYPDFGFMQQKGTVQAYYTFGDPAAELGRLTPERRVESTLTDLEKIHPQARTEYETGFTVAWERERYSLGGFGIWPPEARRQHYPTLLEPDGRVYLAGEHVSWVTAWQEGAIASAWQQIDKLHERVMQTQAGDA